MIVKLVQIPQYNEWICDGYIQAPKRSGKTWGELVRILGGFMVDLWWIYRWWTKKNRDSTTNHWIGLRENLQETMVFTIKYGVSGFNFPVNQSNEPKNLGHSELIYDDL